MTDIDMFSGEVTVWAILNSFIKNQKTAKRAQALAEDPQFIADVGAAEDVVPPEEVEAVRAKVKIWMSG
jgi:hypothetical protein